MSTREEIVSALMERPWFQATSAAIKEKVLGLPESCNGFLEHLKNRPDAGGGVRVLSLHDLLVPELPNPKGAVFGLFPVFNVEKEDGASAPFTYQYFIWKQGPVSGVKGVVLIEGAGGEISHVVCMNGFSFAIGANTFDSIGGFAEMNETGIMRLIQVVKREITEELGLERFELKRMIHLGPFHPDRGMTPNCPQLFAAVIDGSDAKAIREGMHVNTDAFEMTAGAKLVPVSALWGKEGFLMNNTDAFFLSCVARLVALGLLGPTKI